MTQTSAGAQDWRALLGAPVEGVGVDETLLSGLEARAVDVHQIGGLLHGATGCARRVTTPASPAGSLASQTAAAEACRQPARPMARIIRRTLPGELLLPAPLEGMQPVLHAPVADARRRPQPRTDFLPAPRGVVWHTQSTTASGLLLSDRRNYRPLVVLMIALWAGIVGFGIYKGMTPPSGLKIKWDNT